MTQICRQRLLKLAEIYNIHLHTEKVFSGGKIQPKKIFVSLSTWTHLDIENTQQLKEIILIFILLLRDMWLSKF